jgi:hypothetical protein
MKASKWEKQESAFEKNAQRNKYIGANMNLKSFATAIVLAV